MVAHQLGNIPCAVEPKTLITCYSLVAGASKIELHATDGQTSTATVIHTDESKNLAMLKVNGDDFAAMALADAFAGGNVGVAAFLKPSIFQPEVEVAAGEMRGVAGKYTLRMTQHPRLMGCPVVDDQGRVVGVVSATRDEPVEKLSVIGPEALKSFAASRCKPPEKTAGNPDDCVVEVLVTK